MSSSELQVHACRRCMNTCDQRRDYPPRRALQKEPCTHASAGCAPQKHAPCLNCIDACMSQEHPEPCMHFSGTSMHACLLCIQHHPCMPLVEGWVNRSNQTPKRQKIALKRGSTKPQRGSSQTLFTHPYSCASSTIHACFWCIQHHPCMPLVHPAPSMHASCASSTIHACLLCIHAYLWCIPDQVHTQACL